MWLALSSHSIISNPVGTMHWTLSAAQTTLKQPISQVTTRTPEGAASLRRQLCPAILGRTNATNRSIVVSKRKGAAHTQKAHDGQAADGHRGEAPALEGHMNGSRGEPSFRQAMIICKIMKW